MSGAIYNIKQKSPIGKTNDLRTNLGHRKFPPVAQNRLRNDNRSVVRTVFVVFEHSHTASLQATWRALDLAEGAAITSLVPGVGPTVPDLDFIIPAHPATFSYFTSPMLSQHQVFQRTRSPASARKKRKLQSTLYMMPLWFLMLPVVTSVSCAKARFWKRWLAGSRFFPGWPLCKIILHDF